ncbi:uncharacterized protein LOC135714036 isoform X1 [Ochlerotatus camptorhynchus]|uniref:uncharacterized protein LOC135714036 isoform X1 n=2 Tax=Ochlerotatus camptorhynchus TaxID=644619 RepID=UPI0031D733EA
MEEILEVLQVLDELRKAINYSIKHPRRTPRRWWVRPSNENRDTEGFFETEYMLMRNRDPEYFIKSVRMNPDAFDLLLSKVGGRLEKFSWRKPISPECRLFMTLMFLAHGSSVYVTSRLFRMGESTVRLIVYEVCEVLWDSLVVDYMPEVDKDKWSMYSQEFYDQWNFPNCCGAIDGKHVSIQCPPNSGSLFFNYKHFHSINLMGVCDANYNFIAIDVGGYGGNSDGGIFAYSEFGRRLVNGALDLPAPGKLPGSNEVMPYFIVGDAAFPLKNNLLRPYPGVNLPPIQDNFNQRLSRARRTIENSFGILVARWRILKNTLVMLPGSVDKIVKACVILHNFVKRNSANDYCPPCFVDQVDGDGNVSEPGEWRTLVDPLRSINSAALQRGNNATRSAYANRDVLAKHVFERPI